MNAPSNTPRRRSLHSFQELKDALPKTDETLRNANEVQEETKKEITPGQCPICLKHIGRGITGHIKSCQPSSSFKTA
jgi:6-phosphogluconolactonase/glucosamine-6-phosphate isomerase/deaminase